MYDYIEGHVVARRPTALVVDVAGVGYEVAVPLGARFAPAAGPSAPPAAPTGGETARVWTHFVVREDSQQLFGFADTEQRELFRLLLKVRGVGPGLALAVLSSLPGDELLEAIATENATALTRVKGVGKKTAEQILLDLRDRAPLPAAAAARADTELVPHPRRDGLIEDAERALASIGFSDKEAQKSVARAAEKVGTEDLELLVRTALRG